LIEAYWAWVGGPTARLLGSWVDGISIPISEILLILALALIFFRLSLPWIGLSVPIIWWIGPILLGIMAFSQGVTTIDWVPSVFRTPPHIRAGSVSVGENFHGWKERVKERVFLFSEEAYLQAESSPNLKEVDRAVKRVLNGLSYPPGREVKKIKEMMGLTRLMGLAYGGPAYHDVVTGEVVMAAENDLPRTKVYRWLTVVHEIAHAQGFTREIDAEVLTWLILKEMESPFAQFCADVQALSKGPWEWKAPPAYRKEQDKVLMARKSLKQPVVAWLSSIWKRGGLQNNVVKYGSISKSRPPVNHPFFGVVLKWDVGNSMVFDAEIEVKGEDESVEKGASLFPDLD